MIQKKLNKATYRTELANRRQEERSQLVEEGWNEYYSEVEVTIEHNNWYTGKQLKKREWYKKMEIKGNTAEYHYDKYCHTKEVVYLNRAAAMASRIATAELQKLQIALAYLDLFNKRKDSEFLCRAGNMLIQISRQCLIELK